MKITESKIRKGLEWLVKLAFIFLSSPATWSVASNYIADSFIIKASATIVLEASFLLLWVSLERKANEDGEKVSDALALVALYIALLTVSAIYGHGIVGWVFFVATGVMIARSTYQTLAHSFRRNKAKSFKDREPRKVRKARREQYTRVAIAMVEAQAEAKLHALQSSGDKLKQKALLEVADSLALEQPKAKALPTKALPTPEQSFEVEVGLPIEADEVVEVGKGYVIAKQEGIEKALCLHPECNHVIDGDNLKARISGHMRKHAGDPIPVLVE